MIYLTDGWKYKIEDGKAFMWSSAMKEYRRCNMDPADIRQSAQACREPIRDNAAGRRHRTSADMRKK